MCNSNQCWAVLALAIPAVGGVLSIVVSENYATERTMWDAVCKSGDYQIYIENYPHGTFTKLAEKRLQNLQTHQPTEQNRPIIVPTPIVSSPIVTIVPTLPPAKVTTTPTLTLTPNPPPVPCTEGMINVPTGIYNRSKQLQKWVNVPTVTIDTAFSIQDHEVTVAEFNRYYNSLDEPAKESLSGVDLLAADKPITGISWQVANDYVVWLNKNNHGCKLSLPSVVQWQAATLRYAQSEEPVVRRSGVPSGPLSSSQNRNLLGNVQEWTQESCVTGGHLVVGADFKTKYESASAQPRCTSGALDTIGLRLVHNDEVPNKVVVVP